MRAGQEIYVSTVGLDRNRWGSREPTLLVSDWLARFKRDGFDGIELWEFHYLRADADEQARLAEAGPVAIYNSYVGFDDEAADARAESIRAIERLQAGGVKYNLGNDASQLDAYRRNLLEWADMLPASCRSLCECHPGTVLEELDAAVSFFRDLDPERFGVIAHLSGDAGGLSNWFDAFGSRTQHLHIQWRAPEHDTTVAANRPPLDACFEVLKERAYGGSMALEFSRGIGRDEDAETIYRNTCVDLAYVRQAITGRD